MTDLAQVAAIFGIAVQKTDRAVKTPLDGEGFEKAIAALMNAPSETQKVPDEVVLDVSAQPFLSDPTLAELSPIAGFQFAMAPPSKEQGFLPTPAETDVVLFANEGELSVRATEAQTVLPMPLGVASRGDVIGIANEKAILSDDPEQKIGLPLDPEKQNTQSQNAFEIEPAKGVATLPGDTASTAAPVASLNSTEATEAPEKNTTNGTIDEIAVAQVAGGQSTRSEDVRGAYFGNDLRRPSISRSASETVLPTGDTRRDRPTVSEPNSNAAFITETKPPVLEAPGIDRSVESKGLADSLKVLPTPDQASVDRAPAAFVPPKVDAGKAIDELGMNVGTISAQKTKVDVRPAAVDTSANEPQRPSAEPAPAARAEPAAEKVPLPLPEKMQSDLQGTKPGVWAPAFSTPMAVQQDELSVVSEQQENSIAVVEKVATVASNLGQSAAPIALPAKGESTAKPELKVDPSQRTISEAEKNIYDVRITKEDGAAAPVPTARGAEMPFNPVFAYVDAPVQSRIHELALDGEVTSLTQATSTSTSTKAMEAVAKAPATFVPTDVMKLSEQLRAGARMDRFPVEIALDPPELGQVRMMLQSNESGTTLVILADRPETADLMRKHAAFLHEAFAQEARGELNLQFGAQSGQGEAAQERSLGGTFGGSRTSDDGPGGETERLPAEKSITDRHREIGQMSKTLNLTL